MFGETRKLTLGTSVDCDLRMQISCLHFLFVLFFKDQVYNVFCCWVFNVLLCSSFEKFRSCIIINNYMYCNKNST
jgi:hypothetical protein